MEITGRRCISWLLTMFQRNVRIGNILRKREHCLQSSGCSFDARNSLKRTRMFIDQRHGVLVEER